jgi:hypothetical protein
MENKTINPQEVKGWGIDADPKNEPTYPMKRYTGDDHSRLNYERPAQQVQTVEVLHSNERPGLSAVFGTSTPPSGLSGIMRRYAFNYSENHYGHWLTLIMADRVNVIEGVIADIKKGHFPNIFAEKGGKAQWKYNRRAVVTKVAAVSILSIAVILFLRRKKIGNMKNLFRQEK